MKDLQLNSGLKRLSVETTEWTFKVEEIILLTLEISKLSSYLDWLLLSDTICRMEEIKHNKMKQKC